MYRTEFFFFELHRGDSLSWRRGIFFFFYGLMKTFQSFCKIENKLMWKKQFRFFVTLIKRFPVLWQFYYICVIIAIGPHITFSTYVMFSPKIKLTLRISKIHARTHAYRSNLICETLSSKLWDIATPVLVNLYFNTMMI